jgi:hypothetical protein
MTDDLDALTQRVANHLAGQPVQVRWQQPEVETALGQTYKTASGMVIDINDRLELAAKFRVYLHELAHCRLDADWIPVTTGEIQTRSVTRSPSQRAAWRADPHELRANALAAEWESYAEKNAYKYWRIGREDPMTLKLYALLNWR